MSHASAEAAVVGPRGWHPANPPMHCWSPRGATAQDNGVFGVRQWGAGDCPRRCQGKLAWEVPS
eukprot:12355579-Alexandrium_andersonii.AAC.1